MDNTRAVDKKSIKMKYIADFAIYMQYISLQSENIEMMIETKKLLKKY